MDPFDSVRLAFLRAELARARLEKIALTREIQSPLTIPVRKHRAVLRYPSVDAELRIIAGELENFIDAAKRAQAPKKTS